MGLHISAIILTEWLLIAGWFSEKGFYYELGALIVVTIWWAGWRQDKPRWPSGKMGLAITYLGFGFLTGCTFIITKTLLAFLILCLIGVFMLVDLANQNSQKNKEN